MTNRKGLLMPFATTVAVVLVSVIVVVAALFAYLIIILFGDKPENSYVLLDMTNAPFVAAYSTLNLMSQDRYVSEHALESSVSGSLQKSSSASVPNDIGTLMEFYDFSYYSVDLFTDKEIFSQQNTAERCGSGLEGYCVSTFLQSGKCGTSRVKIDGECGFMEICCKEERDVDVDGKKQYVQGESDKPLQLCGNGLVGVCDYQKRRSILDVVMESKQCREGRISIEEGENKCTENKYTCCMPIDELPESPGFTTQAEVPLLYKGEMLYDASKEYQCLTAQNCDSIGGFSVTGLCSSNIAEVRCCVTDVIKCKPPAQGVCLFACSDVNKEVSDATCPATLKCCNEEASVEIKELDVSSYGKCKLGGSSYYSDGLMGTLTVTVRK